MLPFWKYIKEQKKVLFLALFLAAINQIFSLLDPQIFRLLIDQYATRASDIGQAKFIRGVLLLLGAFVGVALVSRTAKTFQDYFVNVVTQRVGANMYAKSVEHTFSLPFSVYEDRRSGEVLSKLQKARTDAQSLIEGFVNTIFLSVIGMIFVIAYAWYVHWLVGLAYLALLPIVGTFTFLLSKKIKYAQKKIVTQTANLAGATTETLRNVELVKSLGLEAQEIKRLNKVNEEILNLELGKIKMVRTLMFYQGTLVNAMRAMITFVLLWLVFQGAVSIGEFFTLFVYSFFIFSPLAQFGSVATQFREAKASNEELEEILSMPAEPRAKHPLALQEIKSVSFHNVRFQYVSAKEHAVQDITLSAVSGQTIAFVGPSGSGKSTLMKLLVGLHKPSKGEVRYNDIDLQKLNVEEVRSRIGLVAQETQLFAGSLKDNLLFVNPTATKDDCVRVLKLAQADHLLKRGKGLGTLIGEGGIKLSGGEKQRLAIARALLRNPELIIFDEATSALDSLTEKEITETIKHIVKVRPNIITVLIAHRLSTIAQADTIYVLEKGKIIETGTHTTLLAKKGLYAALWRQQSAQG
ncbi:MAG: ABC transporter ATP-binding protein [Candidatus Woesearchaeota archaeon]|nr:MAG: ABC transporter ATP-binding protein [Candidatus Woesearchaeota archaeon]